MQVAFDQCICRWPGEKTAPQRSVIAMRATRTALNSLVPGAQAAGRRVEEDEGEVAARAEPSKGWVRVAADSTAHDPFRRDSSISVHLQGVVPRPSPAAAWQRALMQS